MNLKVNSTLLVIAAVVSSTIIVAVGKNGSMLLPFRTDAESEAAASAEAALLASPAISMEAMVDTPPPDNNGVDLTYPIYDRLSDWLTSPPNPFDLQDPSNVKKDIEYDPGTGQYILTETIGDQFFRNPTYMTFEEYLDYQSKQSEQQYWFDRSNAASALSQKGVIPEVNVNNRIFDRIFGGTAVDIRPQGNIDLTFGGNYQNILNPILTKRQSHQGGFDFDMNIQINVVGKIGDKLKLTTNYNTGAVFNFENQVKLDYTGYEDEIIKKIEAGNVSLPLKGTLITGNQSLFGLKTQLQFGRLTVTNVISQQQSQAQNITVQGGAQTQTFRITADQYDENRNFLLAQYFRQHYNEALAGIPVVNSQVTINKIEVWVTNKTGATVDVRDVVAFMDLGESSPYSTSPAVGPATNNVLPYANNLEPGLNSNNLYTAISHDNGARSLDLALQTLTGPGYNLQPIQDFEKTYARKLGPNEYTFDPRVGYLMLNQQLNPDEVLGVAYQYTVNGQVYQVGEFAADVPPNVDTPGVLFLKMLKSTSTRTKLPIWDLMMKNVYSLGAYQVNAQDFFLDVYYLDPGGGEKRYVPADNINGTPLIQVLGLDRLNNNNDPQPDGVFDFISGITINPSNGKVIFPVLEPFGSDLTKKFSSPVAAQPYVYQVLYDSTKTIAYQFPEFNRYSIKGTYKSSVSSEISLGAFNVPNGSVSVTAGGQKLIENVDFTVDYNLGRVKILNQSLLNSGVPINVAFENNELFSFQIKTLFGARLDYYINDKFTLGGTLLKLWERPYTVKLNAGDDPISNAIYGLDGSYTSESVWLTKMVNAIPLINTKETSSVTLSGEAARLAPGHSKAIGKDGTVYIDDFEGTQTSYDLRFPFASWSLASTPQDPQGGLFPEGTRINDLSYGFNRAKFSWYNIDPFFWGTRAPAGIKGVGIEQNNFYSRPVQSIEIFPQQDNSNQPFNQNENTFDIRFEPGKRGPYNFDTDSLGQQLTVDANGDILLPDPERRWGGIQRAIDQTDFEEANIEYIQFWVLDPFLNVANDGGDLYINLGNISEDVLKDSKFQYENGLSPTGDTTIESKSKWAYTPKVPPVTRSFDNDPNARQYQDIGFDGNRTVDEQRFFKAYIDALGSIYGVGSAVYNAAVTDPSNDDYRYYDDPFYTDAQTGILDRYAKYNNSEGNSPISSGNQAVSFAATNEPETEDLNRDNTITENEEYFQYKVHISPQSLSLIGQNFITDMVTYDVPAVDGYSPGQERWYQIKIPINEYNKKVGSIPDFKSIRFIRMYMTGFDTTVIMRFARMELIRNQWRKYLFSLEQPGEYIPGDNSGNTFFNLTSVSLEENSSKLPFNYVLPPGIQREQIVGQVNTIYQNEQSLSLQVCNLRNGDSRAVYKNINLDLRQYQNLKMFVHAESVAGNDPLQNGGITAWLRLGSDFTSNYYEYEVPLIISTEGNQSAANIWPDSNNFDISLQDMIDAKQARNFAGIPITVPYVVELANGKKITVVGNPDLGIVATAMLGVRNPKNGTPDDNGNPVCAEIWFDELRLAGFDENGGYAAIARADIRLADFGTVTLSGSMHTIGYGQLEQKLNDRFKDDYTAYDAATTLELGKFFPKNAGIRLPMYAGISKANSNPQYDPYDHDILLKEKLALISDPAQKSQVRKDAQTYRSIGSLNFSNVRKVSMGKNANSKLKVYSPENLNLTYAYTRTLLHSPIIQSDITKQHHGELGYAFPGKSRYIMPFEKMIPSKNKYLKVIRDFNLNFLPTNLTFRTAMDRQFNETVLRPIAQDEIIIPTYNKYFTWDRAEGLKLDLSKGLNLDFNALANTRIDEPQGLIDTKEKKDSIFKNIKDFGRTTNYTHNTNVNYTVPLNKIPFLDWTQLTGRYGTNYTWLTAPLVLDSATNRIIPSSLGNTISNTQNLSFNGEMNFRNLYNKSKFLKRYDTNAAIPNRKKAPGSKTSKNKEEEEEAGDKAVADPKKSNDKKTKPIGMEAYAIRIPLMLKRVSLNYTENHNTVLPGYLFKPRFIGQDFSQSAPGWGFIFGYQPDSVWMNKKAQAGWISSDTTLNYMFVQNSNRNTSMKATLEPFKDLLIDLNFSRTNSDNISEYFKRPSSNADFQHLSRVEFGTYTSSYIPIKTSFVPLKPNDFSETFVEFAKYRETISKRLGEVNPNSIGTFSDSLPNYEKGYGPFSTDVLIPAFLAAYGGKDPASISLGLPLNKFPLPNWRVTYNGLTKIPWAKKIWSSVNISHAYNSNLSIASFSSSLDFVGATGNEVAFPSKIDSLSGNFISFYDIPAISITEAFSPLIGIDMTWKNSLTTKFEYKRGRNLSFSFLDYQLTESRTQEITIGLGYKFRNATLPFKIDGKKKRLKNDITFLMNVSYGDNITLSQKLNQETPSQATAGIETLAFSPTFDYVVNNRLSVRLFFNKRYTIPKISNSYPIRYTDGGVTIRFTLGQ